MLTLKSNVKKRVYTCDLCNYKCSKKFLLAQHKKTKKHQMAYRSKYNIPNSYIIHTCECGKTYKHVQSFYRHKKKCISANSIDTTALVEKVEDRTELKAMLKALIEQNQLILTENNEMRNMVRELIPRIGNNNTTTITNQFNLNVFLNNDCKDALNLTDFVNTLDLKVSDLEMTREKGYENGIANIFLKGLKALDMNKRPIHCSDIKREILYVKDNDIWEKENHKKERITKAISTVAKKQIDKIKLWELNNPGWQKSERGTQEYCEMVREVTSCGTSDTNNKIIKKIAKEVIIEK